MKMTKVSFADFQEAVSTYLGWCKDCEGFTRDDTEGDAENYDCPICDGNNVIGAENAMIMGLLDLED